MEGDERVRADNPNETYDIPTLPGQWPGRYRAVFEKGLGRGQEGYKQGSERV
jgi:hypothetical protein